jgi:tetratricopeptide (TPR) repeat protein
VAIKVVSPGRVGDAVAERRLVQEARAAASLDHPCICPVYDAGTGADGRTFIVMQYVEGETLADRLRRGPLDVRHALLVAADVADALSVAHQRGIVHRDLKPQNVMLTPSGRPKLLDFGLAKRQAGEGLAGIAVAETHTALTVQGAIVGTPGYMSPEQVRGQPIDGRSDLFSLGAVLYECLTGRRAFAAPTTIDTYGQILNVDPPPVSAVRAEASPSLDLLCARLLAKAASERFQSADEALGALRVLANASVATKTDPRPAPNRPEVRYLAALVLVAAAALGGFAWSRWPAAPPEVPGDAAAWYERGTASIRDGAYHRALLSLTEAIRLHPAYPQAHARLAEAQNGLDEEAEAARSLARAEREARDQPLPEDDRLRLDGIAGLVLRDNQRAVAAYTALAARRPDDAGVRIDLGRAQEAAELRTDARASYLKALALDRQYAAAHLRLGRLAADEGRRDEALAAYREAERLYGIASSLEGQAEAVLRQGAFLNGLGEIRPARDLVARAASLAARTDSLFLQVRAALESASVTASEGRYSEAEAIAAAAIDSALRGGLDTVAATGLIELGSTLLRKGETGRAEEQLQKAVDLATRRDADSLAARASLQLASLMTTAGRSEEAIALVGRVLPGVRKRRNTRVELNGLLIQARAQESLLDLDAARRTSEQVLELARSVSDEANTGYALDNLAALADVRGALPEALDLRQQAATLHRRVGDDQMLGWDLSCLADLLLRLGRPADAVPVLAEIAAGAAAKPEAWEPSVRSARELEALAAAIALDAPKTAQLSQALVTSAAPDAPPPLAGVLLTFARARLRPGSIPPSAFDAIDTSPGSAGARERAYWRAVALWTNRDPRRALAAVDAELGEAGPLATVEREWRLAALGAACASALGQSPRAAELTARARTSLGRLREVWKDHAVAYEKRPDLVELKRRAGL